jgi:hypothetical protein
MGRTTCGGQCPLTIDVAVAETKSTAVRKVNVTMALPFLKTGRSHLPEIDVAGEERQGGQRCRVKVTPALI